MSRIVSYFRKNKQIHPWKHCLKVSLITLLIGIGGVFVWGVSAEERFYHRAVQAYESNEWLEYESFRSVLTPNIHQRFDQYLRQQAEQVVQAYLDEQLIFEAARDQIQRIEQFSDEPDIFLPYQEKIKQLKQSRRAFKEGETYAKEQAWESARLAYTQVVDWDPNYEKAQAALRQVSRWELEDYLVQAITHFEDKEYDLALTQIDQGLSQFPDHPDLLNLKQDIETAMTTGEEALSDRWSQLKEHVLDSLNQGVQSIKQGVGELGQWIQSWWK